MAVKHTFWSSANPKVLLSKTYSSLDGAETVAAAIAPWLPDELRPQSSVPISGSTGNGVNGSNSCGSGNCSVRLSCSVVPLARVVRQPKPALLRLIVLCGIMVLMLRLTIRQSLKLALAGAFAVVALGFSHGIMPARSASGSPVRSAPVSVQCTSICIYGLPSEEQDGILQKERDDKAPKPVSVLVIEVIAAFITLSFVVKLVERLSSWRPPDRISLYGQRLFYA